ncbi:hypothetical protein EVB81_125 [Rhizobium phage RHph_I46]|uniref:Uncharacterized protein n=1 Tax=Rhizobium phage RHph_I1_9 TaxID=2509729 RepID=A0A7S5RDN3_9CAUD|nr:hypothetical protein PP936_gp124 [Rhizobium phage RHph_I1_9]QIG69694.1 hypothetical protein EVB81_125 [Rhizobium phage RHph_I46]QIG70975.1 hypothetical protein EVB92_125 [Rhizobium phage RHph_I9]QIG73561.1 hypothetical protein EVC04_124 [Rhizobium phage RHph_I1_9]QIG76314.1 hypothetical protein EVC25_125 [Rhizobium phage RHph_I34]
MGLTLFVYGEVSAPNFEVLSKVEDDQDAFYHLQTCIEDTSRFYRPGSRVIATHLTISNPEFDEWVETGHWSEKTETILKKRIADVKTRELEEEDEDDED